MMQRSPQTTGMLFAKRGVIHRASAETLLVDPVGDALGGVAQLDTSIYLAGVLKCAAIAESARRYD